MDVTTQQRDDDRDRAFADWGELVTLSQVTQSFDPAAQQISEIVENHELIAIVGVSTSHAVPDAAGQAEAIDLVIQFKAEEFPATRGDVTWKVSHDGATYDVVTHTQSAGSNVVELACRRIG